MAFAVRFYRFSKKPNSTAIPASGATYSQFNCTAKGVLDLLHPEIVIRFNDGAEHDVSLLVNTNYARIPSFERWYFVKGWRAEGPLWIASLDVDALASWRETLGAQNIYIYRSGYTFNGRIPDNLYPTTSQARRLNISIPKIWTVGGANAAGAAADTGLYILGIAGNNGTRFYAFEPGYFRAFMAYIFSNTFYEQVLGTFGAQEYPEAKVAVNPLQFITSCCYVPIGLIDSGYWGIRHEARINHIPVGPVMVPPTEDFSNQSCYPLSDNATSFSIYDIDTTAADFEHPQAAERGEWLNLAPATEYELFYPPFGLIPLDPAAIAVHDNLRIRVTLDARTAEIMLEVQVFDTAANIRTIYRATASFGVSVPISNVLQPGTSAVQVLGSGLGGLITGGLRMAAGDLSGALGILGGAGAAIGTAVKGQIPHLSTMGGPGSTAGLDGIPKLYVTQWYMAPDDYAGRGRPLCDKRTISAIPGYIMGDPDELSIGCMEEEMTAIIGAVRGGFFYE